MKASRVKVDQDLWFNPVKSLALLFRDINSPVLLHLGQRWLDQLLRVRKVWVNLKLKLLRVISKQLQEDKVPTVITVSRKRNDSNYSMLIYLFERSFMGMRSYQWWGMHKLLSSFCIFFNVVESSCYCLKRKHINHEHY